MRRLSNISIVSGTGEIQITSDVKQVERRVSGRLSARKDAELCRSGDRVSQFAYAGYAAGNQIAGRDGRDVSR